MSNINEKNNKKKKEKRKNKRTLLISILFLLFVLTFGSQFVTMSQTKVEYPKFIEQVQSGKVISADINSNSGKVKYKLKDSNKTYYTNYPYTEDFVETLLLKNVDIKITETSWLIYLLKYGMTPLMFILLLYFIYNTGMSDFKVETIENVNCTFKDVAGMEEIKEDMLLISQMMKDPSYRESGAKIPRGILLEGPPGNGKTLLARAFAGETGVNFIAINACDLGSQFVGIGSSKIKKVFEAAKRNSPCVIFIDELDSVGAKRSSNQDSASKEMNTMLTALLNQMDGFEVMDNVMVLAATNRSDGLDEALVRPGRFDRKFVIDYPDKKTRKEILELYSKNIKLAEDVSFDSLANKMYGYSSSKIACIVNEAIINSVKNKNNFVTNKDFEEAVLQMDIKGHVKKNAEHNQREKEIVAYHEAGHAVIAYFLTNKKVSNISIKPTTSGAGGFTITENDEEKEILCPIDDYKNEIIMLYGGRAAEVKLCGSIEQATAGAMQDIKEATKLAINYVALKSGIDYSVFGEQGTKDIMQMTKTNLTESWTEATNVIDNKWEYVDKLAKELIDKEVINAEEFSAIMNSNSVN